MAAVSKSCTHLFNDLIKLTFISALGSHLQNNSSIIYSLLSIKYQQISKSAQTSTQTDLRSEPIVIEEAFQLSLLGNFNDDLMVEFTKWEKHFLKILLHSLRQQKTLIPLQVHSFQQLVTYKEKEKCTGCESVNNCKSWGSSRLTKNRGVG